MNRDNYRHQHRILLGIVVIVIGILLLLGNLNIFDTRTVLRFWPLVFVIFGGLKVYQARHPAGFVVGGTMIVLGVLMTLHKLGIIYFHLRDWWPLFMIAGGVILLSRGLSRNADAKGDGSGRTEIEHGNHLNTTAVMSGANVKSDAQEFRGGELTAVMGGIELDLTQASIRGEAVLYVFAFWGGISITVPPDWSVIANGVPLLGGFDDKSVPPMNSEKRLVIEGYAIMGGVEIKN
ncbi:MAG TPA: DUF5668 domain-containing protein [Paucimonas sp.]|nr:DUF5668 domain-containing protein [Paucimonas sp.]